MYLKFGSFQNATNNVSIKALRTYFSITITHFCLLSLYSNYFIPIKPYKKKHLNATQSNEEQRWLRLTLDPTPKS